MFSKVKEITRKFTPSMGSLISRDRKVIGDEEGMKSNLVLTVQFFRELYSVDQNIEKEQADTTYYEMEPEVLEAEIEWTIKQLEDNKTPGQEEIPIELIIRGGCDDKDNNKNMQ